MQLIEKYKKEVVPAFKEKYGYNNALAVPKIDKVVLNVGISADKLDDNFLKTVEDNLTKITGQKPAKALAKKAISAFKIKQGDVVGMKVILRGKAAYDFVEKLVKITLPRVKDFRGIKLSTVDNNGNLNLGFKEQVAFPEIDSSEIELLHGLEVNVVTTAKNKEQGMELFKLLDFPFQKIQ